MSKVEVALYYADWCGHCQSFKSDWNKLKPLVKEKYGGSCKEYEQSSDPEIMKSKKIKGYPTIMIRIGNNEEEYNGSRKVDAILNYIEAHVNGGQSGGGMNNDYYQLYLKYKAKYLKLKML